jgi:uncharacterized protein (TIGR02246 family)
VGVKWPSSVTAFVAVFLSWLVAPPSGAGPPGPESLVGAFASAWNSHSMPAFERLFTEDADWVTTYDTRDDGRAKIVADLKEAHEGFAKETTVVVRKTSVRLLRPDIAVVHFNAELTWPGNEGPPVGRTMLFVTVREAGTWKISAGQITKPNCPEQ